MTQMRSGGFVGQEILVLEDVAPEILAMTGEIACLGGIVLRTRRTMGPTRKGA